MSEPKTCCYQTVFEGFIMACAQNCTADSDYCIMHKRQLEEIDRVCASYPELTDDEFVRENRDRWLG